MARQHGGWIWYELMTTDPEGAKAFYEPIVGWQMSTGQGVDPEGAFFSLVGGA